MPEQTNTDIIKVLYKEGEDKPWFIDYEDVGVLKTARAALNYPAQSFETEEKAIEVATMLRDIIKADAVAIPSQNKILDDVEPAEFFHPIHSEEKHDPDEHEHLDDEEINREIEELDGDQIRANREAQGLPVNTDTITIPGPSQQATEQELGISPPPRLPEPPRTLVP